MRFPYTENRKNEVRSNMTGSMKSTTVLRLVALLLFLAALLTACGYGSVDGVYRKKTAGGAEAAEENGYGKGALFGSVYSNSWAGITVTLPDGFSNGSQDLYRSVENDTTDCGLYAVNAQGDQRLFIGFEKVSDHYTAEDYVNILMGELAAAQTDTMTIQTPASYTLVNLGGADYISAPCVYNISGVTVHQTYLVRKVDNRIVFIVLSCPTLEAVARLTGIISSYKN